MREFLAWPQQLDEFRQSLAAVCADRVLADGVDVADWDGGKVQLLRGDGHLWVRLEADVAADEHHWVHHPHHRASHQDDGPEQAGVPPAGIATANARDCSVTRCVVPWRGCDYYTCINLRSSIWASPGNFPERGTIFSQNKRLTQLELAKYCQFFPCTEGKIWTF